MKIVVCGLKMVGRSHVQQQIDFFHEAIKMTNMVVGFDLVCEEDFTPPLEHFIDQIYQAKEDAAKEGREFPLYLHCGETNDRDHT